MPSMFTPNHDQAVTVLPNSAIAMRALADAGDDMGRFVASAARRRRRIAGVDSLRARIHSYVRMKVKLTLYVDQASVRRGKAWARRRKVPLSRLVEEHLNRAEEPGAGERFVAKWQGRFAVPEGARDDPRVAAILDKHAPAR